MPVRNAEEFLDEEEGISPISVALKIAIVMLIYNTGKFLREAGARTSAPVAWRPRLSGLSVARRNSVLEVKDRPSAPAAAFFAFLPVCGAKEILDKAGEHPSAFAAIEVSIVMLVMSVYCEAEFMLYLPKSGQIAQLYEILEYCGRMAGVRAFSGVWSLALLAIHLFQFCFGETMDSCLCPPPFLIMETFEVSDLTVHVTCHDDVVQSRR